MTQVKLLGELGEKFGTDWQCAGKSMRDIIKLIDCQVDGFREYLTECHEKNIGFTIQNGEDFVDEEIEMWLPNAKDTVIISPVPAGSGKGLGKILAAIAIIALVMVTGGAAAGAAGAGGAGTATATATGATATGAATTVATTTSTGALGLTTGTSVTTTLASTGEVLSTVNSFALTTKGYMVTMLGANLGLAGIMQMTNPDPGEMNSDPGYFFNGAENNIEQGQPVPVLYGTLKIGGTAISQGFAPGSLKGSFLNLTNGTASSTYWGGLGGTTSGKSGLIAGGEGAVMLS